MSNFGNEKSAVQNTLIKYACDIAIGWEYIAPNAAERLRGGRTGLIFREVFANQIKRLNPFVDSTMIEEKTKALERLPARMEGNLQAWEYLKGLKTVFLPKENRERNLIIIDKDSKNNIYQITDEYSYTNGVKTNRYDVVFLINGVPVFFVECKAVAKFMGKNINRESIIAEALEQIRRYHSQTPEPMTLFQVYTATNIINFLYAATWSLDAKSIFNWKAESKAATFEELVKGFFDRQRITDTLLNYILFTRQDDEIKKVILRPHQMQAVARIVERAASDKKRGLIWHTQGSGKTYTMIVAAQQILNNPILQNPTVIMLVDRNELETQLFGNLSSLGIEHIQVAESKKHLQDLLQRDSRGLIVTMIHKFENMPEKINLRKNIFVLVDEAHRTTGGDLGNYLMGALPNASYIGFTGTPIDQTAHGKGTFKVFGLDDAPHGYLDKYGIAESIEDGTTVKLHYTLAPNELRPDRALLEKEFLLLAETQGISDIEVLNKVLEKAVNLKNMLKNPQRMQHVAEFIAKHFAEYIEPMGYKAFLVAVDREACALYKKELDKLLPKEYSEVVYSSSHNDLPPLSDYHLNEEQEKIIRKNFRKPDINPKILIVTEKLLTGFDAPILYCMYLDKPMRDHVLLQAIARVNRPYEDDSRKKPSGFVLDFIGLFDKLETALAFDSADISGIVKDIEVLKQRFSEMLTTAKNSYLSLIKGQSRDKAVEALLEAFRDEDKRETFYEFFDELSLIYEMLSPDAFLRPYIDDYDTLARMYNILKEAYDPGITTDREFTRKTAQLVRDNTKCGQIKQSLEIYEINEGTLRKLQDSNATDTEKVFNLLVSIKKMVANEASTSPYLRSIGEKAELISTLYKQRQIDTQEALARIKLEIDEANKAKKTQAESNLPKELFSAYWIMKNEGLAEPEELASNMKPIFEKYPYWATSEEQERELKQGMNQIFIKSKMAVKKSADMTKKILAVLKSAI
jgi:type I restriction enzyme, R subunit